MYLYIIFFFQISLDVVKIPKLGCVRKNHIKTLKLWWEWEKLFSILTRSRILMAIFGPNMNFTLQHSFFFKFVIKCTSSKNSNYISSILFWSCCHYIKIPKFWYATKICLYSNITKVCKFLQCFLLPKQPFE